MAHIPVLLNETLRLLDPKPREFFIDGTFGGGGHSKAILNKIGSRGNLLVLDWDKRAIAKGKQELAYYKNVIFVNDNYVNLPNILQEKKLPKADGLLLDLGFSSDQLESLGKGFSFNRDEPLLMTYSNESTPVHRLLEKLSEKELAEIIWKLGEERFARKIASAIYFRQKQKPIKTSGELAEIIKGAVPGNYERGRIHPATRTFQAFRIYANKELDNLDQTLKSLDNILNLGGRAGIISFHSLEDRLVKNNFRDSAKAGKLIILTKKPITANSEEIVRNPRSRSAKLRAAVIKI